MRKELDFILLGHYSYDANVCPDAMDFHHRDPLQKDGSINNLMNRAWVVIENELKKCSLLCCRCHRELHWVEKQGIPYDTGRNGKTA